MTVAILAGNERKNPRNIRVKRNRRYKSFTFWHFSTN